MSATDELRRMLDEAGVEWWQSANTLGCIFTRWYSPLFGDEVYAMENGDEGLVLFDHYITPAQAIAATVGRGTCRMVYNDLSNLSRCNACGWRMEGVPMYYCPRCGRKVVDE